MVAALTLDGVGPLMRFDGAMTTARFEGYVRHSLVPTLRKGQVVIADNLSAHHSPAVRAAIEQCGARFLPLPPYSPDFNPIEEAFSKVKHALRQAQARTDDDLRAATWATFRHQHQSRRHRLVHSLRLSTRPSILMTRAGVIRSRETGPWSFRGCGARKEESALDNLVADGRLVPTRRGERRTASPPR